MNFTPYCRDAACRVSFREQKRGKPRLYTYYRFENWNRFRAPFCPYFLRSLARGSRVTMPSAFSLLA